jgi:tetratricopeptide (TPR) repeat protein
MGRTSQKPEKTIQFPARVICIVLVCLVAYVPAVRSGFVWDDDAMLTENSVLKEGGLYRCWFTTKQPNYWPITWTSYWLEHKLWGLAPAGYHITNILIHIACALLIWRILIQLNIPAAFAAALIFAVHPVNVESVAWIAQRKTVLAMLFFLLSLFYYLRFDQTGKRVFYVLSVTLFILAMLSKGSVVGLPIVILLCVWWLRGTIAKRDIICSIPFFAVSAVMSAVEIWFQYNRSIAGGVVRSDSFLSRLAGAGWAAWFYLYKAILPANLTFIYPRWKIDPANLVSYVPGLLLVVLLALAWRYRRSWGRPVLFALVYYIVMLLPVLGFFNIYFMRYSLVADHYQYASIISIICLVVGIVHRCLGAGVLRIAAALIMVTLGTAAWQRSSVYRTAETLWYDTLAKDPNSWMAHNNLGLVFQSQGRYKEAITCYRQSLRVKPDHAEAYNNLGIAVESQGGLNEAITCYRKALDIDPNAYIAHYNLGSTLLKQDKLDEAAVHFHQALKSRPDDAQTYYNLGLLYQKKGNISEAITQYRQAVNFKPDHARAYNNMAVALMAEGKLDEAINYLQRAVLVAPDYVEAHNNLGRTLLAQGKFDEAIGHFQAALRIRPDFAEAKVYLERALKSRQKSSP